MYVYLCIIKFFNIGSDDFDIKKHHFHRINVKFTFRYTYLLVYPYYINTSFYWRCLTLLMLKLEGLHLRYSTYIQYLHVLVTFFFTVGIREFAM